MSTNVEKNFGCFKKILFQAAKGFATPSQPASKTPGSRGRSRKALREKNETFVRGMVQHSIASVDGHFDIRNAASSTQKAEDIVRLFLDFDFILGLTLTSTNFPWFDT